MSDWSPNHYLSFEDERTRPARDLLARVPIADAQRVVDLGCGPGNSTELLMRRFPGVKVTGVDNSSAMLASARQRLPEATFVEADIATWTPSQPVDLIFANAVFQWVPDHAAVLVRLMESLAAGGILAVQIPDNFGEPAHYLMEEVARPWSVKLDGAEGERERILPPAVYYDRLSSVAVAVDIWRTVYHHPLSDAAAIVSWFRSTGLRPYLNRLAPAEQEAFLAAYTKRVGEAYPRQADGRVLLAFPRVFIVAART
jgi:trans-aconitate 2-methyltransferase